MILKREFLHGLAGWCNMAYPPYTTDQLKAAHGGGPVVFFNNRATDTQAYVLTWPDRQVLVFRGTQVTEQWSWTDIKTNLQRGKVQWLTGGKVHRGYGAALISVWHEISDNLNGSPLTITGHSLGGVLATLASTLTDAPAITFGAPAVGDGAFADRLKAVTRVVRDGDIAPKYPRWWRGYRHGGDYVQINRDGELVSRDWNTWSDSLILPFTSEGVIAGVRRHSIKRYEDLLASPVQKGSGHEDDFEEFDD